MASSYDSTNIKVYDNEVIQDKLENQLTTQLDMNQFITIDNSLSATPGMKVEVHKYTGTGNVQDLTMSNGNTGDIGSEFTTSTYEVKTTQGRVPYYDEQIMNDPVAIDKALQHLSEQLTNDLTTKVVAELGKATNIAYSFDFTFGAVVDAIASMPNEQDNGLYMLISKEDYATLQKNLNDNLKYVEDFARRGYVGTVAGVPVYVSKAITKGTAFMATREAITAFVKKGVEVEQEREPNTRKTTIYGRKVMVIALTDDTKAIKLTTSTKPGA